MTADDRLDAAPCGFLTFADDGTLAWANRTLLEMLGYERDEVVGRHVERLFSVGTRIFYQTHWFPLLRLHGRAEEIFLMLRARDGRDVGVLANAARRERGGRAEYDCVVMRVRERQKYEDELLRARRAAERTRAEAEQLRAAADAANRAKSRFLANMSHELRTPLNAIAGYVQILAMGIQGPVNEAQREMLDRITRGERHLLRLVDEVLDLARIEAGHIEYEIEDVPVAELVAAVTPMVEPQAERKGLALEVDVSAGLLARADRERAQQILLNLLGNAVKFTPSGGRIRVEAALAGERVELRVSDTGVGIAADELGSIFEPFVQAGSGRDEQGSGLGLAISRDLARGMGGDLTVASAPGEGSTFTLALPRGGAPG